MPGHPAGQAPADGGIDLLAEDLPAAMATADDPPANLALDEAMVRAAPRRPVLRLWQNVQCVVIGRGQRVAREVNLAACVSGGVAVLRRASGGGAVFHDLGNLNVSIAVPGFAPGLGADLAGLVADAIERLGLVPSISERGVFVGPDKVSGLAAQLTRSGSLAHATLLVTTPAAHLLAHLAGPPADSHPLDSRRAPVRPLCDHDSAIDVAACRTALLGAAAARYGGLTPRLPLPAERRWHRRLLADRYRDPAWHLTGRPAGNAAAPAHPPGRWARF